MACFIHFEKSSLGNCKQCQKHLCSDCIEIVDNCVCCHDPVCHQRIKDERAIIERSKEIYAMSGNIKQGIAINYYFYILIGIIFFFWGIYMMDSYSGWSLLPLTAIGIVFTCYGLYNMFKRNRF